jgi:hypothetical protein
MATDQLRQGAGVVTDRNIITAALGATAPAAATAKAKYTLEDRIAEQCRTRCAALLDRHPLYAGIEL